MNNSISNIIPDVEMIPITGRPGRYMLYFGNVLIMSGTENDCLNFVNQQEDLICLPDHLKAAQPYGL
jgi:hypothetical protein